MATKKTPAAKSSKAVKPNKATAAKKSAPVAPAEPAKKAATPAKKASKAAPAVAEVKPATAVASKKNVAIETPKKEVKKKESVKSTATEVAAPAKKVAAKKVEATTKATPKSVAKPTKTEPAKPEKPAKIEKAVKEIVVPKVSEPAPKAVKAPKPEVVKKATTASSSKKALPAKSIALSKAMAQQALPKPTPTPAAKPMEKKATVIIAHRKLENKAKKNEDNSILPPYKTEVYRSILDEAPPPPVVVYRYSDEELIEFRELISNRLEAARKELGYLQGLITRRDEAGTEDTENRYMSMEDGSGAMEREQLSQLASRQIQFISHLEKALIRIENKTYGVCRVTGKLIDKARLRAVPHATLSIEAKNMMTKK